MEKCVALFQKLNRSKAVFALLLLAVFGVMLLGNFLTDPCSDDFGYMYSFADGERIEGFSDLLSSMHAHYYTMNGRILAHTFAQIFETLPKPVFNVLNGAMFTLSLLLIYRLCTIGRERNNLVLLGLFSAIWIYEPGFGEVNFWLDGACNYLWGQIPAFLFISVYIRWYLQEKTLLDSGHAFRKVLFVLLSLVMGLYLENLSGAMLFMAILILCVVRFREKRAVPATAVISVVVGILGYATMVLAPAERTNKTTSFSFIRRMYQFEKVMDRFHVMGVLIVAFIILMFLAFRAKLSHKRIMTAIFFGCGCFGAGMIFMLTNFYPPRCAAMTMLFIVVADGILLTELLCEGTFRSHAYCALTILLAGLLFWCPHGMKDIFFMHQEVVKGEAYIEEQKAQGVTDIVLEIPKAETKYTAFYGLIYLTEDDPDYFANSNMAKYYGVNSIVGVKAE